MNRGWLRTALGSYLAEEQRETIRVVVVLRWLVLGAAAFVVDYRHGTAFRDWLGLNALLAAGIAMNAVMQWQLLTGRRIPVALPVGASVYDAAAVTVAIALVDGFANTSFLLYYPAILAYSVAFPGKFSLGYSLAVMVAYGAIAPPLHGNFDPGTTGDQKALVLRLSTMFAVALTANLIVRVERERRERAVASEARRAAEVQRLEQEVAVERQQLMHEVHDGVAQGVYMISLGVESVAGALARRDGERESPVREQVEALGQLAKQTLLETRSLMYDLGQLMDAEASLVALARSLAGEFQAVSGIETVVEVAGPEPRLPPRTMAEVFRVIQGALGNVLRHSGATRAQIGLDFEPGRVVIGVSDNGRGFDPTSQYGTGRRAMEARAARLGGILETVSAPGAGARVTLAIPIEAAAPLP